MAYHIWFQRVSGGVDVFLLLSGFLITGSLVRSVERHGRVDFVAFYARIARRIFPPALFVLIGVVVAALLFLPQTRWRDTLGDVVAAALYHVNWRLASNSVDYLGSQDAASPVQHYWSLAIQGQFYLTWPALIAVAALLAVKLGTRPRVVLGALLGVLAITSLAYSVHRTSVEQIHAYFDTFTRVWELALGGLLLLALPFLKVPRLAAPVLGLLGLAAVVTCGMVFREGNEFPGWAALWPTLAASVLIVATPADTGRFGVGRLLRSPMLGEVGKLAYTLFLWHWPVLICYLAVTGYTTATLRGGLLVIAVSVVLAVATRWLLEIRLRRSGIGERSHRGGLALAGAFVAAALLTTGAWHGYMQWELRDNAADDPRSYPGAAHLADGGELPQVPYRPDALSASDDRAIVYENGCHQTRDDSEVIVCEFGPADASRSVALVGGSHSAHWLPALQVLADERDWLILSITKSACRFDANHESHDPRFQSSCREWNEGVIQALAQRRPDVVFTTSTSGDGGRDYTPDGYLTQWQRLAKLDLPVVAIRDVVWHDFDVPECVANHGPSASRCGGSREAHGLVDPPDVTQRPELPDNVRLIDLTDFLCTADFCPAVVGNVLVYHDAHHLSATYSRTLAPYLGAAVEEAMDW